MHIKATRHIQTSGGNAKPGDVVEVPDKVGERLINDGSAEKASKTDIKAAEKAASEEGGDLDGQHSAPTKEVAAAGEDEPTGEVATKDDGGTDHANAKKGEKQATKEAAQKAKKSK